MAQEIAPKELVDALKQLAKDQKLNLALPYDMPLKDAQEMSTVLQGAKLEKEDTPLDYHTGPLDVAADYLGAVADVPFGLGRTAATALVSPFVGKKKQAVTAKDVVSAFQGQAPTPSDYVDRMGIEQGSMLSDAALTKGLYAAPGEYSAFKLTKGGVLDTTTAKALANLLGQINPFYPLASRIPTNTALGKLASIYAGGTGVSSTIKGSGKMTYRSAPIVKAMDNALAKKGKGPVSPYLMEKGVWGTPKQISKQVEKLKKELGAELEDVERKVIINQAQSAWSKGEPPLTLNSEAVFRPTEKLLSRESTTLGPKQEILSKGMALELSPEAASFGKEALEALKQLQKENPEIDIYDLIKFKQRQADAAKAVYENSGRTPSPKQEYHASLADDARTAVANIIENPTNAARLGIPEDATKYSQINKKYGLLKDSDKARLKEATKKMSLVPSIWDLPKVGIPVAVAYLATHSPVGLLAAALAAKGITSTAARTGYGLLANRVSQNIPYTLGANIPDALTRELIWAQRSGRSPYQEEESR